MGNKEQIYHYQKNGGNNFLPIGKQSLKVKADSGERCYGIGLIHKFKNIIFSFAHYFLCQWCLI